MKYIILVRALPPRTPMKELVDFLNKVKNFSHTKTFFNTGNIILDANDKMDKKAIDKEVCNILTDNFNMNKPLLAIFNLDEYKDILSSNPFDEPEKSVIFFPIKTRLEQDDFDKEIESKCKVVDGTIYYLGPTSSKISSEVKVFRIIDRKTKTGSNNEYTFRTWNSSQKILALANKE
ncbi:hypothetical protein DICPUDRAFT_86453 [Dictyostelium purpureum]|uniref:DUF1697 domain-containing protein n=1 Tax=Dictyostelium purpureum TaxID=5786 RepID=F0ZBQ6_DICPU|nr:uncharacterized protein DICPUDRAFT_86453 [Dictyostelium purpureum]EGC38661.1 hypothetical protein DICPUDRAFT_86453 [Dictyostelium purpureum]|eukprot:XP_003284854.1 hypothetical protein DICPUDRAFT_86453 [Dictyostelium purpureum]